MQYSPCRYYRGNQGTIQQLKNAIKEEIKDVTVAMVDRTIENLQHVRLPMAMKRQGAHLEHLL